MKPRVLLLARSAFAGWIAMLIVWAVYVFLLPHRLQSEIGPLGAFVAFGLVLSALYLVNFLIITIPIYLLSQFADKWSSLPWVWPVLGAALYLFSVVSWCLSYNTQPEWHDYVLAATAGAASVFALSSWPNTLKRKTEPLT
jgi:hypothetical protein